MTRTTQRLSRQTSGDTPIHVGLYSPALPDSGETNGIVTYSRIMRDALRALGHSATVLTPQFIEHVDGRVMEIPMAPKLVRLFNTLVESRPSRIDGSHPAARLRLFEGVTALRQAGVQIFEMEESFGWAGRIARRGLPIVERLHGPHAFGRDELETVAQKKRSDAREAAELRSFERVDAITCPSQRLLAAIVERGGLPLGISHVIPNPIPIATGTEIWRSERADPEQILCVGRFDSRKGADVAIRAFAIALQQRPSLKLVMVGPDRGLAQRDGSFVHFDEFMSREMSPHVRERLQFLGVRRPERIRELRLDSGLALVASRFENFAYSIAEAMAIGMPVLASDTFGNGEMIRDGVDGRIVPASDPAAMARAMLAMAGKRDCLADMGRAAYNRAAEWLAPDRVAKETVDLYRAVLARRATWKGGSAGRNDQVEV